MNTLGERYVRLVLAMGQHDADYVDSYYGPARWREEAESERLPLAEITVRAAALARDLAANALPSAADALSRQRHQHLTRQLEALRGRASMLSGTRLTFDEESQVLYDAVAPPHTAAEFDAVHSVQRAKDVGSVHEIISAERLRPELIAAVERGLAGS